jgi:hypothetical protein
MELIKSIIDNNWTDDVHLVLRPRHCGKATMLQMLGLYAGYLTEAEADSMLFLYKEILSVLISAEANDRFKIPNPEVMTDWARWIVHNVKSRGGILKTWRVQ